MSHLSLIASKQATAFVFRTAQLLIFCHSEEANIEFGHLSREKWPTKNLSFSREKSIFFTFLRHQIRSDDRRRLETEDSSVALV